MGFALLVAPVIFCARLGAQAAPSASTIESMLQNPAVAAQLQARIAASGLTPDQIRDRLEAQGYPRDLLDRFLSGDSSAASGPVDSTQSSAMVDAIGQIGLIDPLAMDSVLGVAHRQTNGAGGLDSLFTGDSAQARRVNPRGGTDTLGVNGDTSGRQATGLTAAQRDRAQRLRILRQSLVEENRIREEILRAGGVPGLTIFGLRFFERGSTEFEPDLSGPVDASYQIGPGDQLQLIVTGQVELTRALVVSRDGMIVIPQVGELHVANLTLGQLTDILYDRLGRVYSGIRRGADAKTHFSISVSRLHANQIYVVGDVLAPGSYQISSAGTALTALYAALGPSANGSLRHIEVLRGNHIVDSLDVYDYLLRGDAAHDIRLQNGDRVFVPVHGPRVAVAGRVTRPAIYELRPGETLRDAIADAGGLDESASHRRIEITRIVPPNERGPQGHDRQVIDIAADDVLEGTAPTLTLVAGDSVAIFPIATRVRNRLSVHGSVWAPGDQAVTPGKHLSDALKAAGGIKSDAYLGEVLITRMAPDSSRIQLRTTLRDTTGKPTDDVLLQEDDDIHVFSVEDFRPRRYVAIAGAIRNGGRYSYRDGMTLRDLVLLSGGLLESADLREAEIARLPENRAGGVTAVTTRVPLDSSYLFDRGPDGQYLGPPGPQANTDHALDVPLKPYDNVLILRQPDWSLERTVVITGEVVSPGRYTLRKKTERLHDLIERAQGLTKEAYAGGLVLYRKNEHTGRVGVNLERVMKNEKDPDNLILQDGDSLFVPTYSGVVRVAGDVNAPTVMAYVPNEDLNFYVRAAGGVDVKGDGGRAYVKQPDGKYETVHHYLIFFHSVPKPKPGSTVYVPLRYVAPDNGQKLAAYALIAQVLASLATIVAIARPKL